MSGWSLGAGALDVDNGQGFGRVFVLREQWHYGVRPRQDRQASSDCGIYVEPHAAPG